MSDEVIIFIPTPEELTMLGKKDLQAKAAQTAKAVSEDGRLNELEVYIRAKKLVDFAAALASEIKPAALKEALKVQQKGSFAAYGTTVTHKSTPAKWDFSKCNDPQLEYLEAELVHLKQRIENRQNYLKGLPDTGEKWIDPDTGEEALLRKAVKTSGEDISITY